MNNSFLITESELNLKFERKGSAKQLAFKNTALPFSEWQRQCSAKLKELLNITTPPPCEVRLIRQAECDGVKIKALIMQIDDSLSIPAYLMEPLHPVSLDAIIAIHGHGEVESAIGLNEDYHHAFALELARAGHVTLCPELRGFGALRDMALHLDGHRLDYWHWGNHMAYSLVTDAIQKGRNLIGETVEDLLRWENWLKSNSYTATGVAGISYGGDLALIYSVFSSSVKRIFASGTLGSFDPIFAEGYNAPAHCIPNILNWMDRSDIAGLNAPRELLIHYGELDRPSDTNFSASYNDTVPPSFEELECIYSAAGCEGNTRLCVSKNLAHEMDIAELIKFFEI